MYITHMQLKRKLFINPTSKCLTSNPQPLCVMGNRESFPAEK